MRTEKEINRDIDDISYGELTELDPTDPKNDARRAELNNQLDELEEELRMCQLQAQNNDVKVEVKPDPRCSDPNSYTC